MEFLFTFWTVNCVIALIIYLVYRAIRKGKKSATKPVAHSNNSVSTTFEKDAVFEHILNVFFAFKDKYPDRIFSLLISPSRRVCNEVAFDITFIFDGNINYYKSDETDEMLESFKLVEFDGSFSTFECTHNTYEQSSNRSYIDSKIKSYVRSYMLSNPTREFDLSRTGARIDFQ